MLSVPEAVGDTVEDGLPVWLTETVTLPDSVFVPVRVPLLVIV